VYYSLKVYGYICSLKNLNLLNKCFKCVLFVKSLWIYRILNFSVSKNIRGSFLTNTSGVSIKKIVFNLI